MQVRLNKYLSQAGVCSRRQADEYIAQGWVQVNGEVADTMGIKIDPDKDKVTLNDKIKLEQQKLQYILLYKPEGYETSHQASLENGKIVYDLLPAKFKNTLYPVGRLDKDTRGLLLFTNDGVLQYRLTHPKFQHEKEYIVKLNEAVTEGQIDRIRQGGIHILGKQTSPCKINKVNEQTIRIVLTEGMNRQIRRVFRKIGLNVLYLKRIRIENIILDKEEKIGNWRFLTKEEIKELQRRVGIID